jgi:hypothetical protein
MTKFIVTLIITLTLATCAGNALKTNMPPRAVCPADMTEEMQTEICATEKE